MMYNDVLQSESKTKKISRSHNNNNKMITLMNTRTKIVIRIIYDIGNKDNVNWDDNNKTNNSSKQNDNNNNSNLNDNSKK